VAGADLIEIPVTTVEAMGRRMAAGGGGFFRVLPYAFSQWAMRRVNEQDERPIIFYFHPWEVDTDQPRVAHAPLKVACVIIQILTGWRLNCGECSRNSRGVVWITSQQPKV
jgi:hypothetical protein